MHTAEALAQFAGAAFVSGLWQGVLLGAAVWLCLRLVPQTSAALRFALWTAVLLVVALLPLAQIAYTGHTPSSASHSLLHIDLRWTIVLASLWGGLSLLRAASLALHGLRLRSLHRQAVPIVAPETVAALLTTDGRPVQLCTSTQLDRPGVIGFFAPRILIPAWLYPQLSSPELEQIVLHEREHLRRRDDWLNLLQKIALVLFPLNPVLIAVERVLCRERELACDDGVLRRTHAPRAYATCLATLAEHGLHRRSFSLALGALGERARQSELGSRIQRILQRRDTASPLHATALTSLVSLVLIGGAAELARCPQLVSFAASQPNLVAATRALPALPMLSYADTIQPKLLKAALTAPRRKLHPVRHKHAPAPTTPLLRTAWPETTHSRILTIGFELPSYTAIRIDGGWLFLRL